MTYDHTQLLSKSYQYSQGEDLKVCLEFCHSLVLKVACYMLSTSTRYHDDYKSSKKSRQASISAGCLTQFTLICKDVFSEVL